MQVQSVKGYQTDFTAKTRIVKSVRRNGKTFNLREFVSIPGTRQVAIPGWIQQLYLTEERTFLGIIPLPDKIHKTKARVNVKEWAASLPGAPQPSAKPLKDKKGVIRDNIATLRYTYENKSIADIRDNGTI